MKSTYAMGKLYNNMFSLCTFFCLRLRLSFLFFFPQFSVYFHNHNCFRNENLPKNCSEMSMQQSSPLNGLLVCIFFFLLFLSYFSLFFFFILRHSVAFISISILWPLTFTAAVFLQLFNFGFVCHAYHVFFFWLSIQVYHKTVWSCTEIEEKWECPSFIYFPFIKICMLGQYVVSVCLSKCMLLFTLFFFAFLTFFYLIFGRSVCVFTNLKKSCGGIPTVCVINNGKFVNNHFLFHSLSTVQFMLHALLRRPLLWCQISFSLHSLEFYCVCFAFCFLIFDWTFTLT